MVARPASDKCRIYDRPGSTSYNCALTPAPKVVSTASITNPPAISRCTAFDCEGAGLRHQIEALEITHDDSWGSQFMRQYCLLRVKPCSIWFHMSYRATHELTPL